MRSLVELDLRYCKQLGALPEGISAHIPAHCTPLPFRHERHLKPTGAFVAELLAPLSKGFGHLTKLTTLRMDDTPAGRSMPAALKAQLEAQGCKSAGNGW